MRTNDQPSYLTCGRLDLDHAKLAEARSNATTYLCGLLSDYFGRVQLRAARSEGLEFELRAVLSDFAQEVAWQIERAYVTEALASAQAATANMFEALAAGALVAHRAVVAGEETGGVAHGLALVAACEGRPEALSRLREEIA